MRCRAVAVLTEKVCTLGLYAPPALKDATDAIAKATAAVFDVAITSCTELSGGDAAYDGGCAVASAYSKAYAEACGSAVAVAVAGISNCECDVEVSALAAAVSAEFVQLMAKVEQKVWAASCNFEAVAGEGYTLDSGIARGCVATSTAQLVAEVRHAAAQLCTNHGYVLAVCSGCVLQA